MKYKICWVYKTKSNLQTELITDYMNIEEALQFATDFEKTGRVKQLLFYDEMGAEWTLKEMNKLGKQIEEEPQDIRIYFDGGYDLQTKEAGIGICIYYKKGQKVYRVRRNAYIDGIYDNNEAEYAALLYGMNVLEELGIKYEPVTLHGDSQVVLQQLAGEWPCYDEHLNHYLDQIEQKAKKMKLKLVCEPVSRKQNKEAHQLATQALEGTAIDSHKEILE
ncbi:MULTISPECIES: ribonuclease H family protein [Bacillus]|uniref:Reverse transcriptase-like protein n=1 Tax=Bacillus arachidis TaxID=2819290 RepID=A0ABS3NUC3_9BACI|nr:MULTISPECIES: ribonuclease H family protein [Bacillus]MBO1624529.1 reverse transcriptase-like protein [Bacillus arachidis]WIY62743.1 ribonuclease H family protein [Bacillus arachidis]SDZ15417.1 ribonuclease HI [Bacillus sp. 166amftsu]